MPTIRTSKQARLLTLALIFIMAAAYRFLPDYAPQIRTLVIAAGALFAFLLSPRGVLMGAAIGLFLGVLVGIFSFIFMGNSPQQALLTLLGICLLGAIAVPVINFIQGNLDAHGNLRQLADHKTA